MRRRRRSISQPIKKPLTEASPSPPSAASGNGKPIGFWMIPEGTTYVKLSIKPSYRVTRNNLIPRFSDLFRNKGIGGKLKAVTGRADFDVSIALNERLLPIWPVAGSIETLQRHFPWIRELALDLESLYKPDAGGFIQDCIAFQEALMENGWAFAVQIGGTICFAGSKSALEALRRESFGHAMWPEDITLNFAQASQLTLYSADGSKGRTVRIGDTGINADEADQEDDASPEDAALLDRLLNDDKKRNWPSFINSLMRKGGVSVLDFINLPRDKFGHDGHVFWKDVADWSRIDERAVRSAFDKKNFRARMEKSPRMARILRDQIEDAVETAKQYASLNGFDLGWSLNESCRETLTEASFRKLMNDTRVNGLYKYGGMRLIRGRWIYDTNVPGRVENSRYVFTRTPILTLDEDGIPMYRCTFLSRWNRNTTGMRHFGRIKFLPPKTGILRKIGRYLFQDQLDLDVHVACTCPDFKFRHHWVLAQQGAAATPTGIGGEATNNPPSITNPKHLPCLCKHLYAMGSYLTISAREHDRLVKSLVNTGFRVKGEGKAKGLKPNATITSTPTVT